MTKSRQEQIAWWAKKVHEQAQEYADIADPGRTGNDRVANKLDAITSLCKRLHFELTGELP